MPELESVAESLGLDIRSIHNVGGLAGMRAESAMDAWANAEMQETHPAVPPKFVDYLCDHGFRAVGLISLFDQGGSAFLATRIGNLLRRIGSPFWPLSFASAPIEDPKGLAHELDRTPFTAARDLCRCLVPDSFPEPALTRRARPRATRTALAPYGIDLDLLRLIVLGKTAGATSELVVSNISMPALVQTLFRSIENSLADQRADGYHWSAGLSLIQPTDPEVLIAVRACLRSEAASRHATELPDDLPMVQALVNLVMAIGA